MHRWSGRPKRGSAAALVTHTCVMASDGSVGGRGGGGFGWFVKSNFFNANQVADIEAGDEFLGQLGREWVVWGEGGVE
jgi:hypothetical protein